MGRKPIDVSVDVSGMMSADLIIVLIIMIVPQAQVIDLRLTNELDETDTLMTILDPLLLRLVLTSVLRLRPFNLTLGIIFLMPD